MKQKDIALIIAIAFVAAILSFVLSRVIFVSSDQRQQQVEEVEAISTTFTPPSSVYFNAQSVNPTQTIQIAPSNNVTPFSKGTN